MHAGGGIIGSIAMEGLTKIARQKLNKTGGVTKLVYIAALLMYIGYDRPHLDFDVSNTLAQTGSSLITQ
jgi:hypothetical protein